MAFGHVPRDKTSQASGLINLSGNIGGSMGISFVTTMLYARANHHLDLLGGAAAGVASLGQGAIVKASTGQAGGKTQIFLYQGLQRQAMMLSFIDSFRILAGITIVVIPLLFLSEGHADIGKGDSGWRSGTRVADAEAADLVSHGVDHVVHANADAQRGKFFGVARVIGPFPGVANVRVE